ncbi:MAG: hypothetical protein ABI151_13620, partial [Chitinophagaceae bacterium]
GESGLPVPANPNDDADPLITAPIYGRWHAMIERVYKDRLGARIDNNYNWVNELNLDPRFRVAAHFGTRVVQENQEEYMEAAWEQIGEVLKVNRQIRFGQFAMAAGSALYAKHFLTANNFSPSKTMLLTSPLQKRLMTADATVFHTLKQTVLPQVLLSAPMRRIVRPRGRLATQLREKLPEGETLRLETLVNKISSGELVAAPPKIMAPGLPSVDSVAAELEPVDLPAFLLDWLKKYPWLPYVALGLALLIILLLLITGAGALLLFLGLAIAAGLIVLWRKLTQADKNLQSAAALSSAGQTVSSVDSYPFSANFRLSTPEENFLPTVGGSTDSNNAVLFKTSLKDMYRLMQVNRTATPVATAPFKIALDSLAVTILQQLKPEKTVAAWTNQQVSLPPWIKDQLVDEGFVEAMAYPKINKPMYSDLKKISDELFLPNVELIEHNSLTLMETNQPFIESYMVGLNHEFARELLWREYPTDQRGSYFRQFWDVSTLLKDPKLANESEEVQREPYYDIYKLHNWKRLSKLGAHDNRQKAGEPPKAELVLVIRGELLKKYPTAVVYAHRAAWSLNKDGQADIHEPRSLFHQAEGDKAEPDQSIVKTPLYAAKVDPDIYFFGFDLTVPTAKGEDAPAIPDDNNAGWFFVIKERPGEPRFGLDVTATDGGNQQLNTWNDLDWSKVLPADEGVIDVLHLPAPLRLPASFIPDPAESDTEKAGQLDQYKDDFNVRWDSNIDAAGLAYILYQVPMMVCTHASKMLLQKKV